MYEELKMSCLVIERIVFFILSLAAAIIDHLN